MTNSNIVANVNRLRHRLLTRDTTMPLTSHEVDAIELWFATMAAEQGELSAITNRHFVAQLVAEIRRLKSEAA
jgi:hypothetical protein